MLNVVQGLAASKAKHSAKLALMAANARVAMNIDGDEKKSSASSSSSAASAASAAASKAMDVSDDAGWDAASNASTFAAAASTAADSKMEDDGAVALVSTSSALLPGASAIHSAADISAFVDELLSHLSAAYAASGKSKAARPVCTILNVNCC